MWDSFIGQPLWHLHKQVSTGGTLGPDQKLPKLRPYETSSPLEPRVSAGSTRISLTVIRKKYTRRESNPQPMDPKSIALSS